MAGTNGAANKLVGDLTSDRNAVVGALRGAKNFIDRIPPRTGQPAASKQDTSWHDRMVERADASFARAVAQRNAAKTKRGASARMSRKPKQRSGAR